MASGRAAANWDDGPETRPGLGTPPEHKRLVALEGGHVPNDRRGFMREVLAWLDKYFGPVR